MSPTSRRSFLKTSAALAAVNAVTRRASLYAAPSPAPMPLARFDYADVQLLDGPMLDQFRHNHALFLALDEDAMLKPFRQAAGMPAPGEDLGGWYSPSPLFDPPKNMTGYIPGHTFGQWVSGLSRAYAVTGDKPTQAKVQRLVAGYAATITPKFYDGYCLPAYTFEKTLGGLVDAHQFAGDKTAFAVLDKATDAVLPVLPPKALDRAEMAARPHPNVAYTWDESYTLPENFYIAAQRGAGPRYHQLAQRFLQDDTYFNPLAEDHNVLPGQHAYSHVNALSSAMQAYLTDGSEKHLRAAKNGFAFVQQQSFATGGWGPDEGFRKPETDDLAKTLTTSHSSFETPCGAYGHFKITRYLMRVTGDSTYGDSMETVLYNTILGARPIRPDGVSFYYADYNNHATKADYEQKWPCCSGTFPQLTADYGISAYLRAPNALYVNLYVPSRVTWKQGSARVTLTQQTQYPTANDIALHFQLDRPVTFALNLRIPAWAGPATRLTINGKIAPGIDLKPGSWSRVSRPWKDGDRVELTLDMPLRLVPLDAAHPNLVALVRGPVALFAVEQGDQTLTAQQLLAARQKGSSSTFTVATDRGTVMMRPYPALTTETYRLYQQI